MRQNFFTRHYSRPDGHSGKKKICETFRTYGSRVVPHLSTRQAQRCLTSEFGWDLVFPPWYDRMSILHNNTHYALFYAQKKFMHKKFFYRYSDSRFRSSDLWVMSPTRYRCAKSLNCWHTSYLRCKSHPLFFYIKFTPQISNIWIYNS